MLSISKAAAELQISPSTLRRLEKFGRFTPVRTPGGHRRYSMEQIEQLRNHIELMTWRQAQPLRGVTLGD